MVRRARYFFFGFALPCDMTGLAVLAGLAGDFLAAPFSFLLPPATACFAGTSGFAAGTGAGAGAAAAVFPFPLPFAGTAAAAAAAAAAFAPRPRFAGGGGGGGGGG